MGKTLEGEGNRSKIIKPLRIVPYDLGWEALDAAQGVEVSENIRVAMRKYKPVKPPLITEPVAGFFVYSYQICDTQNNELNLVANIFTSGICVFTFWDSPYQIQDKRFAVDYCHSRASSHRDISNGLHPLCKPMVAIVETLTACGPSSPESEPNESLEKTCSCALYTMTITFILNDMDSRTYTEMDDDEKRNLQIILEPSIAHEEDSSMHLLEFDNTDPYDFDLSRLSPPVDLLKSNAASIFATWAAVVVVIPNSTCNNLYGLDGLMIGLEVLLQEIWSYIWLKKTKMNSYESDNVPITTIRSEEARLDLRLSGYSNNCDVNLPIYVRDIQTRLVETSGLYEERNEYVQYADNVVRNIEARHAEQQRIDAEKQLKYSRQNQLLLYLIAIIQIAPFLYELFSGQYLTVELGPLVAVICTIIIGGIITIRSE